MANNKITSVGNQLHFTGAAPLDVKQAAVKTKADLTSVPKAWYSGLTVTVMSGDTGVEDWMYNGRTWVKKVPNFAISFTEDGKLALDYKGTDTSNKYSGATLDLGKEIKKIAEDVVADASTEWYISEGTFTPSGTSKTDYVLTLSYNSDAELEDIVIPVKISEGLTEDDVKTIFANAIEGLKLDEKYAAKGDVDTLSGKVEAIEKDYLKSADKKELEDKIGETSVSEQISEAVKDLATKEELNGKVDSSVIGTLPEGKTVAEVISDAIAALEDKEDKDTTYEVATSEADGLMSKEDKAKLDSLKNFSELTEEEKESLKGEKGEDGKSLTFEDLTDEQKEALRGEDGAKGEDGKDGVDGKSAFELAQEGGFEGTQEEWLESLKAEPLTFDSLSEEQKAELKGEKGDALTFEDLSEEQKSELKGEKGDAFTYEDFSEEQLEALKGADGKDGVDGKSLTFDELTEEQKAELKGEKGDALTFEDLSEEQKEALKGKDGKDGVDGKSFTFEDLTDEQKEALRGEKGADGKDGTGIDLKSKQEECTETGDAFVDENGHIQIFNSETSEFTDGGEIKGPKGEDGADGKDGVDGKSAYEIWSEKEGNEGKSEDEFFDSLKGDQGIQGEQGVQGEQGEKGEDGKSALDLYKEEHPDFEGSVEDFFTTLKGADGAKGEDGKDGKSALDLYKEEHPDFEGSVEDFFTTLKGADGAKGEDGKDGADGITPDVKLENGVLYVSVDGKAIDAEDKEWKELGAVKGADGADGKDGSDAVIMIDDEDE